MTVSSVARGQAEARAPAHPLPAVFLDCASELCLGAQKLREIRYPEQRRGRYDESGCRRARDGFAAVRDPAEVELLFDRESRSSAATTGTWT